jgi:hypothetical protein
MSYVSEILVWHGAYGYDIQLQCIDNDGNAFDLTGYEVDWEILEKTDSSQKFIVDTVPVDLTQGKVKYTLESGKFDISDISYVSRLIATKTGVELHFFGPDIVVLDSVGKKFLDEVLKVVNLTTTNIGYSDLWDLVEKAIDYAESELNTTLTFVDLSGDYRLLIKDLAAVAAALKTSGGASSGSSFSLGDFSVKEETSTETEASSNIAYLQKEIARLFELLSEPAFMVGQA